jgi:hypothetical protein
MLLCTRLWSVLGRVYAVFLVAPSTKWNGNRTKPILAVFMVAVGASLLLVLCLLAVFVVAVDATSLLVSSL